MKLDRNTYRDAIDRIRVPDGLEDRINARLHAPQKHRRPTRLLVVAAAVLTLTAALGITAAAIEAKEYREAVDFFKSNLLPTDGLNRGEIKAVHRDITSGNFALAATNSLILREYETPVEGQAITPDLLENLWTNHLSANNILPFKPEVSDYTVDYVYRMDETRGYEVVDHTAVTCNDGAWSVKLDDIYVEGTAETPHGLLVYGETHTNSSLEPKYPRAALIADDGSTVFDKRFTHLNRGFKWDTLSAAIAEDDRIVLFGRGDLTTLTVTFLDYTGKHLGHTTADLTGPYGIREVTALGEEYLVRVANEGLGERILRLDRDGRYQSHLTYTVGDGELPGSMRITASLEYGGCLYLSGYLYPDNGQTSRRGEIDHILEAIFSRNTALPYGEIEGLVDDLRETYTAVLLRCDPATGEPAEFYSVEGAMGDALAIDEAGNLTWDTAHFATAIFSPATSAFTVAADCRVMRFTFDEHGALIRETATDRTVSYAR